MATFGMIKFTELKFTGTLQRQTDSDWVGHLLLFISYIIR